MLKNSEKTFDCIAFKRQAQAAIYEEIKDLAPSSRCGTSTNPPARGISPTGCAGSPTSNPGGHRLPRVIPAPRRPHFKATVLYPVSGDTNVERGRRWKGTFVLARFHVPSMVNRSPGRAGGYGKRAVFPGLASPPHRLTRPAGRFASAAPDRPRGSWIAPGGRIPRARSPAIHRAPCTGQTARASPIA